MAETDDPLKRLLHTSIKDFAAWLLGADVVDARTVNIELPGGEPVRTDQLFRLLLVTGRTTLLHIEFQGRSSRRPMKWRMLDYMARIADLERDLDLYSVVFYIGHGAGAKDTGEHEVNAPDDSVSLSWKYRVVHLWKVKAEDLLALDRPGLLPLLGQTQLDNAEEILPAVISRLKAVDEPEAKERLFAALIALVDDGKVLTMVEKLIEREELLLDTPYLRRIREEGRTEGRDEGFAAGRTQGARAARQHDILDIIALRLNPPVITYRELEKVITAIEDDGLLEQLFVWAVQADSLEDFQTKLTLHRKD